MTRVGWIGLGAMGGPMAAIAAQDHEVIGYDLDPAAVARWSEHGITPAGSAGDAADGVDLLAIMVATAAQVEAVLFGDVLARLPKSAVVVIMATVGPEPMARWARLLRGAGVGLVDAPVSGGVARAGRGDLLIMPSGAASDLERASTLIGALARSAEPVGDEPGDGQKVKLVNQLLCGVHIAVAGEALAFAGALGLDPRACWNVIRQGAAQSFMLDDRGERMLDEDFDDVKSATDIFVKDMGLVTAAAAESGAWTPIASVARDLYARGHDEGYGRKDDSSIIRVLQEKR